MNLTTLWEAVAGLLWLGCEQVKAEERRTVGRGAGKEERGR